MDNRNAIIAKSEIEKKSYYRMPESVSIMSFSSKRKATEKAVKLSEYKGTKAA